MAGFLSSGAGLLGVVDSMSGDEDGEDDSSSSSSSSSSDSAPEPSPEEKKKKKAVRFANSLIRIITL